MNIRCRLRVFITSEYDNRSNNNCAETKTRERQLNDAFESFVVSNLIVHVSCRFVSYASIVFCLMQFSNVNYHGNFQFSRVYHRHVDHSQ
jgi:hypothetical protein